MEANLLHILQGNLGHLIFIYILPQVWSPVWSTLFIKIVKTKSGSVAIRVSYLTYLWWSVVVSKKTFETIDEYIAIFPENVQSILQKLRQTISDAAPEAKEGISYQIPVFKLKGNLVWFAAFKNHIGFYPRASALEAFKDKLGAYDISKGTVKFPINGPIPFDLIKEIVRFRVKENLDRS
ncbi:MAG: DUF1801 domain-containing protein [Candidatus Bathyarchaeia archaeon]|jgi:uncharacterized protein YdhG (YjbR/CyaY superfamily)